jgi:Domain of unknown function (DUF4153)
MNFNPIEKNDATLQSLVTSRTARMRLLIGLIQGLILYFLYYARVNQAWPASEPPIFSALVLFFFFVPILLISGLGHLQKKTLILWLLIGGIVAIGLGIHDSWRNAGAPIHLYGRDRYLTPYPSALLWFFSAVGFYIAHSLVLASGIDKKRIASYPTYFETAWKLLVQIKFSGLFTCALWLVLWLGAGLFELIKLHFLKELLQESWFTIPVTAFAFSCAMHLTDVRPAMVRGIRNLLLVLLSWILPLTVLIVSGFLVSLPFTGLTPLWDTKHATALLLVACAALVILINTAFQNGLVEVEIARILRISARLASFLLIPLVVIAIYALSLRVSEYGWTTDRIIAACCLLVGSVYALGYAYAASQRQGGWLHAIAPVNIGTAMLVLLVLLALFSPLLDPARISVNSQLARLENDRSIAEKFDFDYLKKEGKRYGLAALEHLKSNTEGENVSVIKEKATQALLKKGFGEESKELVSKEELKTNLKIWPIGSSIPVSFLEQDWKQYRKTVFDSKNSGDYVFFPDCLRFQSTFCELFLIDFDGDGKSEILVTNPSQKFDRPFIFKAQPDASWAPVSQLSTELLKCPIYLEKLKTGEFSLETPSTKTLVIMGKKFTNVGGDFISNKIECEK